LGEFETAWFREQAKVECRRRQGRETPSIQRAYYLQVMSMDGNLLDKKNSKDMEDREVS
jgi:hypothetical protein